MTTERPYVIVPVRVHPDIYDVWRRTAAERGTEVGSLIARLAEGAVKRPTSPPPANGKPRRTWVPMNDERIGYARRLAELGYSQPEIAKTIGVSRSSLANHWHKINPKSAEEQAA